MISSISNTYSKHLIIRSFFISALVWSVMIFLDFSVSIIMELENINESNNFYSVLIMGLFDQPHKGIQYIESSMLIGTLISLSIFNQHGNLIFLQSAGFSPLKIVFISGIGPFFLSLLILCLDDSLFIDLAQKSKKLDESLKSQLSETMQWEISDNNLIGLRRISDSEARGIQIIKFNDQQKIISSNIYEEGRIDDGKLFLEGFANQKVFDFPVSFLFPDSTLENLSLSSLNGLKETYQSSSDLQKINSLIFAKILMPFSIMAIIFLAGSLMFASVRSSGVGKMIIIGISLGLIYDLLKDLSVASFLTYQWSILIAHLLPIFILLVLGSYRFQRI